MCAAKRLPAWKPQPSIKVPERERRSRIRVANNKGARSRATDYSWGRWMGHILFPLTPALSPRGGGESCAVFGAMAATEFANPVVRKIRPWWRLFPLPRGRGQGEGKRRFDRHRLSQGLLII